MRGRLDPNLSGGFHRGRLTTPQTPSQQPANRFPSPFTLDNSPQTTDWRRTAHISQNSYHNPCWISKSNTGIPSYTQYTSKWWCSTRGEGCLRLSGSAARPLRTTVQKRLNEIVVEKMEGLGDSREGRIAMASLVPAGPRGGVRVFPWPPISFIRAPLGRARERIIVCLARVLIWLLISTGLSILKKK